MIIVKSRISVHHLQIVLFVYGVFQSLRFLLANIAYQCSQICPRALLLPSKKVHSVHHQFSKFNFTTLAHNQNSQNCTGIIISTRPDISWSVKSLFYRYLTFILQHVSVMPPFVIIAKFVFKGIQGPPTVSIDFGGCSGLYLSQLLLFTVLENFQKLD